jgi:S-adenosylmethionine-dependent methyltransferase
MRFEAARTRIRSLRRRLRARVPKHLAARFTALSEAGTAQVSESLAQHYFPRQIWGEVALSTPQWLASAEGQADLHDHLERRLEVFRQQVVPWLDAAKPLAGAHILEIGCGTGASTVALAEQGAHVVAVDIDVPSLQVASDRCRAHGVSAELVMANASEVLQRYAGWHFDFVIFFACLEHMTHEERLAAMRASWQHLSPGDLWCTIETPNRLWFSDDHTARLDFYHWLPDQLAFEYSRFSPRQPFNVSYRTSDAAAMLSFLRHGRGLSYHEFDLAMLEAAQLDVVSCLHLRQRRSGFLGLQALRRRRKLRFRYEELLAEIRPQLHRGFLQPYLDLIIRKR